MTAIAIQRKQEILDSLSQGKFLRDVAAELGVSHAAISQYLSNDPEYIQARETGAEQRLIEQWNELKASADPLTLARARETWKAATWFAEREFPHRWGQKTETKVDATLQVEIVRFSQAVVSEQSGSQPALIEDAQVIDK